MHARRTDGATMPRLRRLAGRFLYGMIRDWKGLPCKSAESAAASGRSRGRTVVLEAELAELIDRRWQARLCEKDGNVRVAAVVFHRDGGPWEISERPGRPPVKLPGSPISCSTTSAAPRPGTWCARVCQSERPGRDRPPDAQHVRPLEHRQRGRPPDGGSEDDAVRGHPADEATPSVAPREAKCSPALAPTPPVRSQSLERSGVPD